MKPEMRRRVSQIPYTLLAFAGVSGVTLKVVVRCEYKSSQTLDQDDYLSYLRDAHESAARLYTSLAMCDLLVGEQTLTRGCRMSYDPQLHYNPNALPMPVVRAETPDPLQPYEGTKADDAGTVIWYPDYEERERIESAHIRDYNPIHEFLAGCGNWDGKHDYIEDFARRLPTNYADWPKYFHRWFLAMVAQALNLNKNYGNSMVPLLIGEQGYMKTQFCNHILPESMREYYMKDIKLDNAEQVERVLGRMWLVNIDEYDSKTQREQAKIKRLLTENEVQTRKMRSDQYTLTPRLCSFIATTNDPTPLPSGDGTLRYLCVEVTKKVDMSGQIPYMQMYAQAVAELRNPDCIYWFTSDDEREIQQHNSQYQQESAPELVLSQLFEPAAQHSKDNFWTATAIQKELGNHLKATDVPNLTNLGKAIKKLRWQRCKHKNDQGYYLRLRKRKE